MQIVLELEQEEIDMLIEGLDCLKTKISFVKGASYSAKTEQLKKAEAVEAKIQSAASK